MLTRRIIPNEWKTSITIPIDKAKRMTHRNTWNNIIEFNGKLLTKIRTKKLSERVNINEDQQGFRANGSTINAVFILRQLVKKSVVYQTAVPILCGSKTGIRQNPLDGCHKYSYHLHITLNTWRDRKHSEKLREQANKAALVARCLDVIWRNKLRSRQNKICTFQTCVRPICIYAREPTA